jgi:hypothetical protein
MLQCGKETAAWYLFAAKKRGAEREERMKQQSKP